MYAYECTNPTIKANNISKYLSMVISLKDIAPVESKHGLKWSDDWRKELFAIQQRGLSTRYIDKYITLPSKTENYYGFN